MRDLASQHSSFCSAIGESHGSVYYWTDPKRDAFYSDYNLQRYLEGTVRMVFIQKWNRTCTSYWKPVSVAH